MKVATIFPSPPCTVLTNFPLRQVFHKSEMSGRLMKWALELSEYDNGFKPRATLKGHTAADFIVKLTLYMQGTDARDQWTLYVDELI